MLFHRYLRTKKLKIKLKKKSYFFPSITPKYFKPNLTYIMKKHKNVHRNRPGGRESNGRYWDAAECKL